MNETNVYKELYEANKRAELLQNTIISVAHRLANATGKDIKETNMDELLNAVDEKFGVESPEVAAE
ncbi:hypothetical protein EcSzw1_106 [Escherichia phage EcSzw_1]|nr:hypothetical protein EcSzw2_106 [Escherichia phage EcSzw-2]QAY01042.1 hypothetical protein EcSzw1_106 [Escherichia phage EcSzw_1]